MNTTIFTKTALFVKNHKKPLIISGVVLVVLTGAYFVFRKQVNAVVPNDNNKDKDNKGKGKDKNKDEKKEKTTPTPTHSIINNEQKYCKVKGNFPIKYGDKNGLVCALQVYLNIKLTAKGKKTLVVDGWWGNKTKQALINLGYKQFSKKSTELSETLFKEIASQKTKI